MAKKADISGYQTFSQISDRLDDIVAAVRDKDISLERSLDLFDEAIALGSKAVDMVDSVDFTPEEEARLTGAAAPAASTPAPEEDAAETSEEVAG